MMDEVRIWKVARSQADILKTMRWVEGLEGHGDLVAYWKFNEPGNQLSVPWPCHRLMQNTTR